MLMLRLPIKRLPGNESWLSTERELVALVGSTFSSMPEAHPPHRKPSHVRSDGQKDPLTKQEFSSYDAAYDELDRYYGALCCSDDDRVDYAIVKTDSPDHAPEP